MEVVTAASQHLDVMAELLRSCHADHAPLGAVHRFGDPDAARAAVAAAFAVAPGHVALDGGRVAGYLLTPSGYLGVAHHATAPPVTRRAYRALYEAAAADLVADGVLHHSMPLRIDQADAVQALFELEFGVDQIDGIRVVSERSTTTSDGAGTAARFATSDDLDGVVDLAAELQRFHTGAPMFQPADTFGADAVRRGAAAALDDDRSTVVVVDGDEGLIAMAQAGPSSAYLDTFDIGMNVVTDGARRRGVGTAVLDALLRWGASRRYRFASVGWTSANLVSDAFYRSRGFTPVRYRLHRRIAPTRDRTPG